MQLLKRLKAVLKRLLGCPEPPVSVEEDLLRQVETNIARFRNQGIAIGDGCYLHSVTMGHGEPITIGNNCVLTGCMILGHDASPALFIPELREGRGLMHRISKKKPTIIHDNCFVGVNAVVLCGVSVGPNAVVGAGAVVTRDVPPDTVVAGNPARVICTLAEYLKKHRREMREHPEHYPQP